MISARSKLVKPTALEAESVDVAPGVVPDIERELAGLVGGGALAALRAGLTFDRGDRTEAHSAGDGSERA